MPPRSSAVPLGALWRLGPPATNGSPRVRLNVGHKFKNQIKSRFAEEAEGVR